MITTIKIDLEKLTDDQAYDLQNALEKLCDHNTSCKNAFQRLDKIGMKQYDKLCQERGWSMMLY